MFLHVNDGIRGKLYDLDTGKQILKVIWADLDSGLLCAYQTDDNAKVKKDQQGNYLTYTAHARLRWVPLPARQGPVVERCENTGKPAGEAPCPCRACRKYLELPVGRVKKSHRKLPYWLLTDHPCEHYGCGKLAEWVVSDEVELPAQEDNGRFYGRAKTIAIHYWCSKHFQAPKVLDTGLEIVRVDNDVKARPT